MTATINSVVFVATSVISIVSVVSVTSISSETACSDTSVVSVSSVGSSRTACEIPVFSVFSAVSASFIISLGTVSSVAFSKHSLCSYLGSAYSKISGFSLGPTDAKAGATLCFDFSSPNCVHVFSEFWNLERAG